MKRIILALLLVVALVAVLAIPAMAETTETEYNPYHCICGNRHYNADGTEKPGNPECIGDCDGEKHTWTAWDGKGGAYMDEEYYLYLDRDWVNSNADKKNDSDGVLGSASGNAAIFGKTMILNTYRSNTDGKNFTPENDVNFHFDLNGHSITSNSRFMRIDGSADYTVNLTLSDSAATDGTVTISGSGSNGGILWLMRDVNTRSTVKIYGGNYDASGWKSTSSAAVYGGAISARTNNASTGKDVACDIDMYGGSVTGGTMNGYNYRGGAVYIGTGADFTMHGGVLTGGSVQTAASNHTYQGGAVYVGDGTFTMNGGTVYAGNNNVEGGGVFVAGGTFRLNQGTIDARGKSVKYGGCLATYGGQSYIEDGTLWGGTATGSGGGAISIAGGTVTMNGGTVNGGTAGSTSTDAVFGGGCININTSFIMNGGTITGGTAVNGHGGGVNVRTNATFKVSGNARIYGNTGSNVYLQNGKTVTVTDALGSEAYIGVTMTNPQAFVTGGMKLADREHFFSDSSDYIVGYDGGALVLAAAANCLVNGGTTPMKWADAIALDGVQTIQLTEDMLYPVTVDKDLTLDLNGCDMVAVDIAEGAELRVFDSATSDYTSDNYGVIQEITGSQGLVPHFVNSSKHRYLTLNIDGEGYSFHRFYLAVTHSVLRSSAQGLDFKTVFKCNEKVSELINNGGAYGVNVVIGSTPVKEEDAPPFGTVDPATTNEKVTSMTGLSAENAPDYMTVTQSVNAYIKINGIEIKSAVKSTSMQKMIENVLTDQWDSLVKAQRNTLRKIYADYNTDQCMDSWKNIQLLQASEEAELLKIGYAEANINPVKDDGTVISVGLAGYGNEATRLATSVSTDNPLKAICLAVTDLDGETILLISVDSAAVGGDIPKRVISEIVSQCGVPAGNIMISSNHQHSTPVYNNSTYNDLFVNNIVSAAKAALADRRSVTDMHVQTVEVAENTYNFVRNVQYTDSDDKPIPGAMLTDNHDDQNRSDLSGKIDGKTYESDADNDVQLLRIIREGVDRNIMLVNFQVHPLLYTSGSETEAHADIVGLFRNALADELGCNVMYFSGAGGNLNPFSSVNSLQGKIALANKGSYFWDKGKTQGYLLAQEVADAIVDSNWVKAMGDSTDGVKVMTKQFRFNPMLNTVPAWLTSGMTLAQIEARAEEIYDNYPNTDTTKNDLNIYGIYSKYHAKYIVERIGKTLADQRDLYQSVLSFGNVAFAVAPYEMFDENGMQIKQAGYNGITSPYAMTFIATQADLPTTSRCNIGSGYIPSARGYENGGYSVDIARYAAGTGEKAVENFLDMLIELKNK